MPTTGKGLVDLSRALANLGKLGVEDFLGLLGLAKTVSDGVRIGLVVGPGKVFGVLARETVNVSLGGEVIGGFDSGDAAHDEEVF